ncbi:hypothetical protein CEY02_08145 [Bacillus pumilus]|uniref:Uncharacterized protein n=1 Tax=Bacillus pumilus TaxID=1408 RepID=A0A2A5IW16_BACPU|nr:hypothetical protein CEY02_08145 [Bacillus pumilus]
MTIIAILIHVKKKSLVIKKMIGLRKIFGILLEATIPIIILKVSAAVVRSVAEKNIASYFNV